MGGPEGDGKASAAALLRPTAGGPRESGLLGFLCISIASCMALEGLSGFLPEVPHSAFERWLAVAVDHPLRCGLALAFLARALAPPRRSPT